jgi:hypothetical protein
VGGTQTGAGNVNGMTVLTPASRKRLFPPRFRCSSEASASAWPGREANGAQHSRVSKALSKVKGLCSCAGIGIIKSESGP